MTQLPLLPSKHITQGVPPQEWAAGLGRVRDPAALNPVPINLLLRRNKAFPPRYPPQVWVSLPNQDTLPLPHSKIQDAEERKRLTFEAGKGHHPG